MVHSVVHVEINVTQASGAFPITSSTNMGGGYNAAVMNGYKNLWGDKLNAALDRGSDD